MFKLSYQRMYWKKTGWNDCDFEEIKKASEKMFEDWLGKNLLPVTSSDMFLLVSDTVMDSNDVIEGLKLLWKDVCS